MPDLSTTTPTVTTSDTRPAVPVRRLAIVALGQEGSFDIAWGGEIDTALRACAQKLSYELGYSPDARDA